MTSHDSFQDDLPGYVSGRLGAEELRSLERHLEECGSCRDMAATWRRLASGMREGGAALLAPHPGVLDLRAFALAKAGGRSPSIADHLTVCASCALDVEAWEAVAATGRPAGRARGTAGHRIAWIASLSAAAGLILGLALGPLLGGLGLKPGEASLGVPARHLVLPVSPQRGSAPPMTYTLERDQKLIEIDFRPLIPPEMGDGDCCRFEIEMETGARIWSTRMTTSRARARLASDQVIGFIFPAEFLAAGRYRFSVVHRLGGEEASAQSAVVEILPPP